MKLTLIITWDENPKQKTAPSSLTMTVIDLDDEPPKFVDMLPGCNTCNMKCKTCYKKSFICNTSYESKGEITVNPPLKAEDIESVNASVILYYIRKDKLSADITEEIDHEEIENVEDAEYELSVSFDDDDEENQTP